MRIDQKTYHRYKKLLKWDEQYSDIPDDYFWNLHERRRYGRYGKRRIQDTFNISAKHLVRQQKKSQDVPDSMYRNREGLKCAIGILISDRDYDKKMEGQSCDCGLVAAALLRAGHDLDFCKKLQKIHDEIPPSKWERALNRLANEYGIEGVKREWTLRRKRNVGSAKNSV